MLKDLGVAPLPDGVFMSCGHCSFKSGTELSSTAIAGLSLTPEKRLLPTV
jgi:hypothetical protein